MASAMAAVIQERWKAEIEQAVDEVKLDHRRKRTATDRWFRRRWYINQWKSRHVRGPRITTD